MNVSFKLLSDSGQMEISLNGKFDFNSVKDFREAYHGSPVQRGYIIDMGRVEHIDSSALGMLLSMKKFVGDEVTIRITNCKPNIRKIFTIARFDKKFKLD